MVFDERDLVNNEDKKKPTDKQMSFDDFWSSLDSKTAENFEKMSQEQNINEEIKGSLKRTLPSQKLKKRAQEEKQAKLDIDSFSNISVNKLDAAQSDFNSGESDNNSPQDLEKDDDGTYVKNLDRVLHDAMIPYSEFVIMDSALPRVEDGLKPVQRRILYSMNEVGLTPDKPFRKSAKVVGEVMGNYHPHGDSSIYNAMVRMAQKFNMREILVQGHGNFGSEDGDGAAAMRYTEVKLHPLALEMLRDIDKDTVRWSKNYDDSRDEPDMLPSRFPNILVNGANGIAVGLATNIPTHNLGECIDACVEIINNPNSSVKQIMKHIKGPDFPTGGIIVGTQGIEDAYNTGKGKIIIRCKSHFETEKGDKPVIVIDEFPYQVNKAACLQHIAKLKEDKKDILSCISEIRDETDRQGTRAVIILKKDSDAQKLFNYLLKYSDLQVSYGINMVTIADAKPKQLGILEILSYYVKYQREVIFKRTSYDLVAAQEKSHILEGLMVAIQNIDAVIKIIKKSASSLEARENLKSKFALTDRQAQAILDMRLARLTNLEVGKLKEELKALKELIEKYSKIVKSEKLQYDIVKEEMLEIKKKYASKRKTLILKEDNCQGVEELTEEKPVKDVYVCVNAKNCIKIIPEKNYLSSAKSVSATSSLNEVHSHILKAKSNSEIYMFTNKGEAFRISCENIVEARWKERGLFIKDVAIGFGTSDKVVNIITEEDLKNNKLLLCTKSGMVRVCEGKELIIKKANFNYYSLKDNDEIISVQIFDKAKSVLFITKMGIGLNAENSDIPLQGKAASGVKGINLNDGDSVAFCSQVNGNNNIVLVTDKAYAKKICVADLGLLSRNRKGIKVINFDGNNGSNIALAKKEKNTFEVYVTDKKDKVYSINTDKINLESRITKGKLYIKEKQFSVKNILLYLWD